MQSQNKITAAYNKVASNYAKHFINELDDKPLDRLLLKSFYEDNRQNGAFLDLGCGPGQTTKFLADCGCTQITGTDISPEMIKMAAQINPSLCFEVADLLNLKYKNHSFGAVVAFYCIVNFYYPEIQTAFTEINRVLKPGGQLLLSFHTGDETVHLDEMLEEKVDIDFYFLNTDKVIALLKDTGFDIVDVLVRYPYAAEHQTKRAYIRAQKKQD